MAASDARPIPKKNVAYRLYFSIVDADGDPTSGVTFKTGIGIGGAGDGKAAISLDGATPINSNQPIAAVANMAGVYYLDMINTEMNTDSTVVLAKVDDFSSPPAKSTTVFLYPQEAGDIQVQVNSLDANSITSSVIASNAITSSQLAANSITSSQIQDNAITSAKLAANAIGASQIALDAIGSTQLAATAISEIQSGLALASATSSIQTDTTNILTRLPAALVSGRMSSQVQGIDADMITSTALHSSAATEIAQAVWDFLTASAVTANSFGVLVKTDLDATISSRPAGSDYSPGRAAKLDNLDVPVSGLADPSEVLTQAVNAFATATVPALGQGAPPATPTIAQALSLVYMMYRNRQVVNTTEVKLYADDGTTVVTKWPHSESASTYDRSEAVSGP